MKSNSIKSLQKGFSLVELIITIGIVITSLLGIAGLLGLSIRSNETFRQLTICKTLATTIAETIIVSKESGIISFDNLSATFNSATKKPIKAPGPDNIYGTADDTGDLTFTVGPNVTQPASNAKYNRTNDLLLNLTQQGYRYRIVVTPLPNSNNALTRIDVEVYPPGTNNPTDRGVYKISTVFGQYRTSLNDVN
ncbi:MAG: hypothetical protein HY819_20270 [Acidobacteria bacterium]|nr:hypothetical protein [Acidobacteriota bacterium]